MAQLRTQCELPSRGGIVVGWGGVWRLGLERFSMHGHRLCGVWRLGLERFSMHGHRLFRWPEEDEFNWLERGLEIPRGRCADGQNGIELL